MNDLRPKPWVIPGTLVLALMLTIVPLPDWAVRLHPDWAALALIYWVMALPHRVGVGIGWVYGLLLDVLKGALLGQHALGLALVAYLAQHLHQRVRVFPPWQQAISVGLMLLPYMLISLWIRGMVGRAPGTWWYWAPLFTSMLVWPLVFVVLRGLRRRARLS